MVVQARLQWLYTEMLSGRAASIRINSRAGDPRITVHVTLDAKTSLPADNTVALGVMSGLICMVDQYSATDRGHQRSCGQSLATLTLHHGPNPSLAVANPEKTLDDPALARDHVMENEQSSPSLDRQEAFANEEEVVDDSAATVAKVLSAMETIVAKCTDFTRVYPELIPDQYGAMMSEWFARQESCGQCLQEKGASPQIANDYRTVLEWLLQQPALKCALASAELLSDEEVDISAKAFREACEEAAPLVMHAPRRKTVKAAGSSRSGERSSATLIHSPGFGHGPKKTRKKPQR